MRNHTQTAARSLRISVAVLAPVVATLMVFATSSAVAVAARAPAAVQNSLVVNRINAIRGAFGLRGGQSTSSYTAEVRRGVRFNEDPPFAPIAGGIVGEESLWGIWPVSSAAQTVSPADIVNAWVYHDGWEGTSAATWNLDCTSAIASGCNGHRRALLSTPPVAGARLYIQVTTATETDAGSPGLAVAALLVWKLPTTA